MLEGKYRKYPLVPYRMGQVYFERNEVEAASEWLKMSEEWLSEPSELIPDDHWLRIEQFRFSGYISWSRARIIGRLKEANGAITDSKDYAEALDSKRLELYAEAYANTSKIYDKKVVVRSDNGTEEDVTDKQKATSANNLICYALEALDLDGGRTSLEKAGYTDKKLKEYLSALNALTLEQFEPVRTDVSNYRLETICHAQRTLLCAKEIESPDVLAAASIELANRLARKFNLQLDRFEKLDDLLARADRLFELLDRPLSDDFDGEIIATLKSGLACLRATAGA